MLLNCTEKIIVNYFAQDRLIVIPVVGVVVAENAV